MYTAVFPSISFFLFRNPVRRKRKKINPSYKKNIIIHKRTIPQRMFIRKVHRTQWKLLNRSIIIIFVRLLLPVRPPARHRHPALRVVTAVGAVMGRCAHSSSQGRWGVIVLAVVVAAMMIVSNLRCRPYGGNRGAIGVREGAWRFGVTKKCGLCSLWCARTDIRPIQ